MQINLGITTSWPQRVIGACLLVMCAVCPSIPLAAADESAQRLGPPAVEWLISVRSGEEMASESRATSSGVVRRGTDGQVEQQPPEQARVYNTQSRVKTRQVRVLDGNTALISQSKSELYATALGGIGPYGGHRYGGHRYDGHRYLELEYRDLQQGFTVRPQLVEDQLLLEISAVNERRSDERGGVLESTEIETTIRATPGQWIRLGGSDELGGSNTFQSTGDSTYRSTSSPVDEEDEIWVRVERLD